MTHIAKPERGTIRQSASCNNCGEAISRITSRTGVSIWFHDYTGEQACQMGGLSTPIPADWPVQPIPRDMRDNFDIILGRWTVRVATCGECTTSWNDAETTSMTPTPAGRCPFESFH